VNSGIWDLEWVLKTLNELLEVREWFFLLGYWCGYLILKILKAKKVELDKTDDYQGGHRNNGEG
jgi:hypothetical protein